MRQTCATEPDDRPDDVLSVGRTGFFVAALAGVLSLAGCVVSPDGGGSASPRQSHCQTDRSCGDGLVCQKGTCTVTGRGTLKAGLRLFPSADSSFGPQTIHPSELEAARTNAIGLEPSLTIEGTEQQGLNFSGQTELAPSGTLLFSPDHPADSRMVVQSTVRRGQFETQIPPGAYNLTFVPSDRSAIPKYTWQTTFENNTQLQRTLPNPQEHVTVQGQVVRTTSEPENPADSTQSSGIANALVFAVSNSLSTSTLATTNRFGQFEFEVPPNSGRYQIRVAPSSQNRLVPRMRGASFTVEDGSTGLIHQIARLGAFSLESFTVVLEFRLSANLADAVDLENTYAKISAQIGNGSFEHRTAIGSDGEVELELLTGEYTVSVQPPPGAPISRHTESFPVSEAGQVQTIQLPTRTRTTGRVVDWRGRPIRGADIFATPKSASDGPLPDKPIATTGENGEFTTWLQPIDQTGQLVPPSGSQMPITPIEIPSSKIESGTRLQLKFSKPNVIELEVIGTASLERVANTTVELFTWKNSHQKTIGAGTTNQNGVVRIPVATSFVESR